MKDLSDLQAAAEKFLSLDRIAVVGVSRTSTEAANVIYRRLRTAGYQVFPVNPKTTEVEGDTCYPDIGSIPAAVEGAVVVTPAGQAMEVVRQCREAGVRQVWMHRSFGPGSVSEKAVELCREAGISVIPGGCPMMFCQPIDFGHKCIRWFLKVTGSLPVAVGSGRRAA
jgi:predicted CoA-binding protein